MGLKEQYIKNKERLLTDKSICNENKKFFREFLEQEEYFLKRKRDLTELDNRVSKTLVHYIQYFRNVNKWFKNKIIKNLTKEDIKKVYDDLEEGKIKNRKGLRFSDRISYYNKVFKGKPFKLIGKDILAKEVIIVTRKENKEVRFITEEQFQKILMFVNKPEHKLALWLGWDIGENTTSILELKKKDCERAIDQDTKEPYYNIRLRKELLKTSRTERTEPTIFNESVKLLDIVLEGKKLEDNVFDFSKESLVKVFDRAIKKAKVLTKPDSLKPTIKDLRSSMCCNLLNKDWSSDEIKSRLGHKPSSTIIDKYVNYLAKNKVKSRKKVKIFEIEKLREEIKENQNQMKRMRKEIEETKEQNDLMLNAIKDLNKLDKKVNPVMAKEFKNLQSQIIILGEALLKLQEGK